MPEILFSVPRGSLKSDDRFLCIAAIVNLFRQELGIMTPDILHHYRIERELADRLRRASKSERRHLYTEVYNELFVSVPNHCQVTKKSPLPIPEKPIDSSE
jgi:hypothetical protein